MQRTPARLWAFIRSLFTRSFEATLPNGARIHVWPREQVVLPVIAGAADPEPEPDPKDPEPDPDPKDPDPDPDPDPEPDPDPDPDPKDPDPKEPNWKSESRKHERRAKKTKKELDDLLAERKKQEDAQKSEHEKALEKAREEGEKTALTKAEKDRQADRLEVAVTRIAAKTIKVGEGDDAKDVKFADSEDALVYLNRAISAGDLDSEDVFGDDGKVNTESVTEALREILESKPHLGEDSKPHKPKGDADAGKGKGSGAKELEDMSPEELYKRSQR